MSGFYKPLSQIYGSLIELRNWAYDRSFLTQHDPQIPVVSIGNLTVGGTGKTPLTSLVLDQLREKGFRAGVVSRGYKGSYQDVAEVNVRDDWTVVGDEPLMLKQRHPETPIFLSRQRIKAVSALVARHKVDVILADDAFQHRALRRKMDVVLFDATQPLSIYRMLPEGRLREPLTELKRADWMIVTKQNLAPSPLKERGVEWFTNLAEVHDCKILFADLRPSGVVSARGALKEPENSGGDLYLLSGIGSPGAFAQSVREAWGREIAHHFVFPDHHAFTATDLRGVFSRLGPRDTLITTEKDFVRLRAFSEYLARVLVFRVEFDLRGPVNEFWNQIYSLVR